MTMQVSAEKNTAVNLAKDLNENMKLYFAAEKRHNFNLDLGRPVFKRDDWEKLSAASTSATAASRLMASWRIACLSSASAFCVASLA